MAAAIHRNPFLQKPAEYKTNPCVNMLRLIPIVGPLFGQSASLQLAKEINYENAKGNSKRLVDLIDHANVHRKLDICRQLINLTVVISAVAFGIFSMNVFVVLYMAFVSLQLVAHTGLLMHNMSVKKHVLLGDITKVRRLYC